VADWPAGEIWPPCSPPHPRVPLTTDFYYYPYHYVNEYSACMRRCFLSCCLSEIYYIYSRPSPFIYQIVLFRVFRPICILSYSDDAIAWYIARADTSTISFEGGPWHSPKHVMTWTRGSCRT
jgi:hypothetical protein